MQAELLVGLFIEAVFIITKTYTYATVNNKTRR
jgi:hypothetical protein